MENFENQYLKIYREVGRTEILTVIAEEAAEVAQAALKLRRAINQCSGNPTPVETQKAIDSLNEELGDFLVAVNAAVPDPMIDISKIIRTERHKRLRWLSRIHEAKEEKEKQRQESISCKPEVFYQTKEYPVTFNPAQMEDLLKGDL